jgi:medium-chain acyl-[acyl-carrier-protein] hydrolase
MSRWIRWIRSHPNARLRLFCVPYAGGSSAVFRSWAAGLPDDIEIGAIQLPGHGDRMSEAPLTRLTSLLDLLLPDLRPYFDCPYAFFGHSMGALISFELARRTAPQHLFLSGRRAPSCDRGIVMHTLSDADFVAELRSLNGTPPQVLENEELMQLFLPILRADFTVCETYEYVQTTPLKCPISVFAGVRDRSEPLEMMEPWGLQTQNQFSISVLPGDHFFVQTEQQILLKQLSAKLSDF